MPDARKQDSRVGKRFIRRFSRAQKIEAIDRVRNGATKAAVSRDLGIPESTLRGWWNDENKIRNGNASTPDSNSISPATSSGSEPFARGISSGEDNDLARPGPSKRRRVESDVVSSSSDSTPSRNSESNIMDFCKHSDAAMSRWLFQHTHLVDHQAWFWQLCSRSSSPTAAHQHQVLTSTPLHTRTATEAKAMLDKILYNNNNDFGQNNTIRPLDLRISSKASEPAETAAGVNTTTSAEAIQHARQFAEYLRICSDPIAFLVHFLQMSYLLHRLQMESLQ